MAALRACWCTAVRTPLPALHLKKKLPRALAVVALCGCPGMPSSSDAGDGGCTLPSDFPPDAAVFERETVCECRETATFHCQVEGGPRCAEGWACFLKKTADGGYAYRGDGGVECFC